MDNCGKERSHRAVDYNLNSQVPYCLLCAVFLTELSAILYWLMREVTPMDEDYNFVSREGLLPCRVSSKMKIRLALEQFQECYRPQYFI